ncbi:MAG: hypothetical protein L6Q76_24450 [Polyangiaceae bacterium]|nr:hypothetical protein [Polyangiaceae bacterium]
MINLGQSHGLSSASTVLVFALGDEIKDPDTGESLGQLEIVRGRGEAKHVQEKMTTIRSIERKTVSVDRKRPVHEPYPFSIGIMPKFEVVTEEKEVVAPFEGVQEGDLVRVLTPTR